jgi:YidC/Oxa1 family membrane protein insertase
MDRNSVLGLLLILAILIGFSFYNKPSQEEEERRRATRDSLALIEKEQYMQRELASAQYKSEISSPENAGIVDSSRYGSFIAGATGEKSSIVLKNQFIETEISNLGGKISSVRMLDYKTHDSLPLYIFKGDSTVFGFGLSAIGKSTDQMYFQPVSQNKVFDASNSSQQASLRLYAGENSYIEYVYSLEPNSFQVKLDINMVGMESYYFEKYLPLEWEIYSPQQEKGRQWENENTTIHYMYLDDSKDDYLSPRSDEQSESLDGRLKWIAYKQQFFSAAIIADEFFQKGSLVKYTSQPLSSLHLKYFSSELDLPLEQGKAGMKFYFGPNHFPTLKAQGYDLDKLLPLGWGIFGWVNKYFVIPIFNWLSSFMDNYGLIILVLTIIIKMVLFPLTYKSYLSTARMRVLKPEVDQITEKLNGKDQMMKRQQETMQLYKKAGVNPMGGCLPLLIQMPILFAMFKFFPASIELRQESFLWAEDLSTYDSIYSLPFSIPFYGDHVSLFTLLMAVSMILITQVNGANMTQAPGQPNMKVIMWMMPVMMLFWFNSYSSGLSYYYFLANIITLGQTYLIRYFIDDEAILAKIRENKKKPVKKSNFQQKLEKMARDRGLNK